MAVSEIESLQRGELWSRSLLLEVSIAVCLKEWCIQSMHCSISYGGELATLEGGYC